ncbi:MAG TPA: beta-ketoacyl-[acyl-carrier-protein] synthase family protein [Candidatus Polarisedimenticolaceae bacterium]|nr:beta-ketoacyl-[acyl-carrier-protein] synthase family protein [Candidatus Polarisedimenticolaceae bacterium]
MADTRLSRPAGGRRVVVTGLGAVSPNGVGIDRFWCATRQGTSGVSRITEFDVSDYPTRIAGQVRDFDPTRVVSPRDAKHIPRASTLALAAAVEALDDAGIDPDRLDIAERRATAVVVGSGGVGWEFTERQFREYYFGNPKAVSLYTIPSSTPGSISSELSMRFGFRGASHLISTGCTSSSDALGHAFSLIRYRRARMVLAGGTDAPLAPGILRGFCLMKIMTPSWNDEPERASRPFSRDRDGFVLAEGSWMLLLEDLEQALERGATIHAELLGYGATCEAFHRVRLSEDGEEPARAMELALADAGLDSSQIDYVNVHGTSTELNDRIETRALRLVFGDRMASLPVSSLKSMIGHPQGACGAAGVVASLLAMRDRFIPPTINYDLFDPQCDLDVVPHEGRPGELGAVLCNCIGFGSKNSALVFCATDPGGGSLVDVRRT